MSFVLTSAGEPGFLDFLVKAALAQNPTTDIATEV
jgi:hypothetical protein